MRKSLFLLLNVSAFALFSQDTYSIVALDTATREVGSAGASCVDLFAFGITDASFIGEIFPDSGAINCQASYLSENQDKARLRMRTSDNAIQIIQYLSNNDNDAVRDASTRQYGCVKFNGKSAMAAGFTGANCFDYKNHVTGNIQGFYYSIQGNILKGKEVIDSMEARFRRSQSKKLTCRLMEALQGANMVGADSRCAGYGTSSLFSFLKVTKKGDTFGRPSFYISVKFKASNAKEPIDSLQKLFNKIDTLCGLKKDTIIVPPKGKIVTNSENNIQIQFMPDVKEIRVQVDEVREYVSLIIYNMLGQMVYQETIRSTKSLPVKKEANGLLLYEVISNGERIQQGKLYTY